MPVIEVKDVVGGYGAVPILNGVNIAIEQSDIGVIVGPNGAGKSTTLKAIFGLLRVTAGSIVFNGEEIQNSLPDKLVPLGLSFVPQERNVFTSLSVEENLEMGAFIRRDDYSKTLQSIYEMFPALAEKRRQPAGELSGGQRQRIALARELYRRPSLLLLDEATAFVDQPVEQQIFSALSRERPELTVVFVTHRLATLGLADRVAFVNGGRVEACGTLAELAGHAGFQAFLAAAGRSQD